MRYYVDEEGVFLRAEDLINLLAEVAQKLSSRNKTAELLVKAVISDLQRIRAIAAEQALIRK